MTSKEQAEALLKKQLKEMTEAEKRQLLAAIKLVSTLQKPST